MELTRTQATECRAMRRYPVIKNVCSTALILIAVSSSVVAQSQPTSETTGQKTLAATMNVYVFPTTGQTPELQSQDEATTGQTPELQSQDEATCYGWAVQNTGTDPFELAKQAEQQQQQAQQQQEQIAQAGQGAGVKGAVGGAAAGALIGEIASDDAGKGAAYGAAAGAVVARRRTRRAKADASQQVEQQSEQAQQATADQIENFKKAFSVCLEAKEYMVKF
jgi:hypothetical protein